MTSFHQTSDSPTIRRLPDLLIDQIAAGEVVERPRSVLKELVENSIDAKATEIHLAFVDGGRKKIEVRDNGVGIDISQAPLLVERHATSKITDAADLFTISSMGFRGEALASIASVSHFFVQSQPQHGQGFRLSGEFGHFLAPSHFEGPRGTTIVIKELFANMPARLAFLRKGSYEWTACFETLQGLALAHPEISFTASHNDREVCRWPRVAEFEQEGRFWANEESMRARFSQILSAETVKELVFAQRRALTATLLPFTRSRKRKKFSEVDILFR